MIIDQELPKKSNANRNQRVINIGDDSKDDIDENDGDDNNYDYDSSMPLDRRITRVIRRHTSIANYEGYSYIEDEQENHNGKNKHYINGHPNSKQQSSTQPSMVVPKVNVISVACGLTAGVAQAGLFNPFDRALYLSVTHQRPFLSGHNFTSPYQGFFQSVGHRALSGGLYYPLEQFFVSLLPQEAAQDTGSSGAFYNFAAGTSAGAANALLCNPISAIKYKTWGRSENRGMLRESLEMLRKGGLRPFANGLVPTILRDLVFGGTYTFLRFELQFRLRLDPEYQWVSNFGAAALATIFSGPFNLARNVQYATKSRHIADPVRDVLRQLAQETLARTNFYDQCRHLQSRLRIGWGTARVALGMSFGHFVYDTLVGMHESFKLDTARRIRRHNNIQQ